MPPCQPTNQAPKCLSSAAAGWVSNDLYHDHSVGVGLVIQLQPTTRRSYSRELASPYKAKRRGIGPRAAPRANS